MALKLNSNKTVHFIGIGGSGMSGLASILLSRGMTVSGSDMAPSTITEKLQQLGARVFFGHDVSNIGEAEIVVVSTAIKETNEEYAYALKHQLLIFRRAEMLKYLMSETKNRLTVAGTHGKTTTSGYLARLLDVSHLNPSFVIGSELHDYGENFKVGSDEYFVAEADESDGSFLCLTPTHAVITNIEPEHMNYFQTEDNLMRHFDTFMKEVIQKKGFLFLNADDERVRCLSDNYPKEFVRHFGIQANCLVQGVDIKHTATGIEYTLLFNQKLEGAVHLNQFGFHNVYNSLAAASVGYELGLSFSFIKQGLESFTGTRRRLQFVGESLGIRVYDDYGHHPTEIKTTLFGIKNGFRRRIICVFQPHRYSRTQDLMEAFSHSFGNADMVVLTDVFSATEAMIPGVTGQALATLVMKNHSNVLYVKNKDDIVAQLLPKLKRGDVVITMGAGNIHAVSLSLVVGLSEKKEILLN